MANRRMFSSDIVDSDAFLDMPSTSQLLYFHLCMKADDDGFVNPKKVMRMVGAGNDDLKVLISKRFVLPFETGVVVIKHWLIHNYIRKDRYKETLYLDEKALLTVKENDAYTEVATIGQPNDNQRLTQVRLGKVKEEEPPKGGGSPDLEIQECNEDGEPIKKKKKVVANPDGTYGNPDIIRILDYMRKKAGLEKLDGSEKENRQYALLLKKKHNGKVKELIDLAVSDPFHSKNATSIKYIYYNAGKILKSKGEGIPTLE